MDRASQALAQGIPHGVRNTYRALAEHSGVSRSTLHDRAHGKRSKKEKAQESCAKGRRPEGGSAIPAS